MEVKMMAVKLSETDKKDVCSYTYGLIKSNKYRNLDEVAKKYGVTSETIRKVLIEGGVKIPTARKINTIVKVPKEYAEKYSSMKTAIQVDCPIDDHAEKEEEEFTEVTVNRVIKCITCNERHNTAPKIQSIFGSSIDSADMFNFEKLEATATKFIQNNVNFINGKATDSILLVVTGLTMLTTAVITACTKLNVNLTLQHYNRETKKYVDQKIIDNPIETSSSPIINGIKQNLNFGKIYVYKGTDIFSIKENLYMVKVLDYNLMNKFVPEKIDWYITDNFEDSFELYAKLLKLNKERKNIKVTVQYCSCKISGNGFSQEKYPDKITESILSHSYTSI